MSLWPKSASALERLAELEAFLLELNAAASAITVPLFRAEFSVENKAGPDKAFDPVTAADKGAEVEIRRLIAARFPEHGVIGEEYGEDRPDAEFVWILDPVDGTRAFVSGIPLWCHLIGLRYQGEPLLGLIGQPCLDEAYLGSPSGSRLIARGQTTPLKARPCPRLTEATIACTDPQGYFTGAEIGAWTQVRAAARMVRLGGDAYLFALLAAGRIDLVIESGLKLWDIDPVVPVIENAGGIVADWRGRRLGRKGGQVAAAGDAACLDEALVALKRSAV
ncbi:MAG TPA: inositol monophosphatase family protein [Caulobacteraceae bacterium]|nr:inositol monophosphatase family protein [Caulobacteraceae bacterium]